jgi:hypothetical protein
MESFVTAGNEGGWGRGFCFFLGIGGARRSGDVKICARRDEIEVGLDVSMDKNLALCACHVPPADGWGGEKSGREVRDHGASLIVRALASGTGSGAAR